ncbi:hypothetical protein ACSNOK_33925, partial [Streptomyces sp. URMC 126]|uniref:hypothetical protein n=1 Tax=Streptomyces sp. URMC 126 TaxID=3423401 RepID=UPI003F1CE2BD
RGRAERADHPDRAFGVDDLVAAGASPRLRRLFPLLAPLLERSGIWSAEGDGTWRATPDAPTPALSTLEEIRPEHQPFFPVVALGAFQMRGLED